MAKIVIASSLNFRQIHVPAILTETTTSEDFFLPLKETSGSYLDRLSEGGKRIVANLAQVDGITRIGINIHCVSLHLSPAYDWDEMKSDVLEIIRSRLSLRPDTPIEEMTMDALYPESKASETSLASSLKSLELTVHVRDLDKIAAEKKGVNGAYINISYPVVPHKGEFVDLHGGVEHLEVTRVVHWGGSFIENWTEVHFEASLADVERLLAATEGDSFGVWDKREP